MKEYDLEAAHAQIITFCATSHAMCKEWQVWAAAFEAMYKCSLQNVWSQNFSADARERDATLNAFSKEAFIGVFEDLRKFSSNPKQRKLLLSRLGEATESGYHKRKHWLDKAKGLVWLSELIEYHVRNIEADPEWRHYAAFETKRQLLDAVRNLDGDTRRHDTYGPISDWDVSKITDMSFLFLLSRWDFNSDLSAWDVSNVTNMFEMFANAAAFNSDLSRWDVSSVTDMKGMFWGATAFSYDLKGWSERGADTSKAFQSPIVEVVRRRR